jgi:hypothetical protein
LSHGEFKYGSDFVSKVPLSPFRVEGLKSFLDPYMKLNGTIPDGEFIFRDTIPGIWIFRNVKIQAPKYN